MYTTTGINDPVTSALHIILGKLYQPLAKGDKHKEAEELLLFTVLVILLAFLSILEQQHWRM